MRHQFTCLVPKCHPIRYCDITGIVKAYIEKYRYCIVKTKGGADFIAPLRNAYSKKTLVVKLSLYFKEGGGDNGLRDL